MVNKITPFTLFKLWHKVGALSSETNSKIMWRVLFFHFLPTTEWLAISTLICRLWVALWLICGVVYSGQLSIPCCWRFLEECSCLNQFYLAHRIFIVAVAQIRSFSERGQSNRARARSPHQVRVRVQVWVRVWAPGGNRGIVGRWKVETTVLLLGGVDKEKGCPRGWGKR